MTAIQHDKCYHLTLALKSKDCGYKPKRLIWEVDNLKEYISDMKVHGSWDGHFDVQLSYGAIDDRWYSLKCAMKALVRGLALTDMYIFTDSDALGEARLQMISSSIRKNTKWDILEVSERNVKTIQYIKD